VVDRYGTLVAANDAFGLLTQGVGPELLAEPVDTLLVRKHLVTGELAYHYCYIPPGRPVTLMSLVRVACTTFRDLVEAGRRVDGSG
jgi:hypothetical protein